MVDEDFVFIIEEPEDDIERFPKIGRARIDLSVDYGSLENFYNDRRFVVSRMYAILQARLPDHQVPRTEALTSGKSMKLFD